MKYIIFLFLSVFVLKGYAQYGTNNWYFGEQAGISFSTTPPTCLTDGKTDAGGVTSVVSDASGGLLFYSDGVNIWNKNHQIMPNGANINGGGSSNKDVMFIPNPANPNEYYLFSTSYVNSYPTKFTYSVVDVFANGGLGDVVAGKKDITLFSPATGQITATISGDNKAYWVIGTVDGTNQIYSYYVGEKGLVTTPVISNALSANDNILGSIRVSPDGTKVAKVAAPNVELYEFDNMTGKLSNPILINVGYSNGSIEFSPDGTKIYSVSSSTDISQFDISVFNKTAIQASAYRLPNASGSALQMGPDGKIYIVDGSGFLTVIENPNSSKSNVVVKENAISLCGKSSSGSLPNFIQGVFFADIIVENACLTETSQMDFKTPANWVKWNFGDPASGANNVATGDKVTHKYPTTGNYTVTAIYNAYGKTDTLTKVLTIYEQAPKPSLGKDLSKCFGETINLVYTPFADPLVAYKWSTDQTASTISVNADGTYWLETNRLGCKARDTVLVTSNNCSTPFVETINYCSETSLSINTEAGTSYMWSTGATTRQITHTIASNPIVSVKITKSTVNPIQNVDFEAGINNYTTSYTTSQWVNGGEYLITDSYYYYTGTLKDHTSSDGTGKMIVINPGTNSMMLEQSGLQVVSGQSYTFSYWVARADGNNQNDYSVFINGVNVSGNLSTPTGFAWQLVQIPWVATSNSATIQFVNSNSRNGKMALDDLNLSFSFTKTIEYRFVKNCNTTCVKPLTLSLGTATTNTSFCTGDFFDLKPTYTLGTPSSQYFHSIFTPNGTRVYNANVAPSATDLKRLVEVGNFIYRIEDGNSNNAACYLQDDITITVNPLPIVTASSNDADNAICLGESVVLTGSGASSYSWNNEVTNGTAFNPTTATYTVQGTDSKGCKNTKDIAITVNPLPTVTASSNDADNTICTGESVILTGSGASSYSWNNGVTNGIAFSPTTTATYAVQGTDSKGCKNTKDITITVNPLPAITAKSNDADNAICAGESIILTGSGASSYSWNNGVTNGTAFNPTNTATYTVQVTDSKGCKNTNDITIIVNPLPAITANSNDADNAICAGESIILTGSGASSYSWNNDVMNGIAFSPTTTATYTVQGTDSKGCKNTKDITITVNPLPTAAISGGGLICEDGSKSTITFNFNGTKNYTFIYTGGGNVSAHPAGGYSFETSDAGSYAITSLTDGNGCVATNLGTPVVVSYLPKLSVIRQDIKCSPTNPINGSAGIYHYFIELELNATNYIVSGANGSLVGNVWTSDMIEESVTTDLTVQDVNRCQPIKLTGLDKKCSCPETATLALSIGSSQNVCASGSPTTSSIDISFDDNSTGAIAWNFQLVDQNNVVVQDNSTTVHDGTTITVGNLQAGTYRIVALKGTCQGKATNNLTIGTHPNPKASISGTNSICDDGTSEAIISINVSAGTAPYTVGYEVDNTGTPVVLPNFPTSTTTYTSNDFGTHRLSSLVDANGCQAVVTDLTGAATISAIAPPHADILHFSDEEVLTVNTMPQTINAQNPASNYTGTWAATPSDKGNIVNATNYEVSSLAFGESIKLVWTVTDIGNKCTPDSETIIIERKNLTTANAVDATICFSSSNYSQTPLSKPNTALGEQAEWMAESGSPAVSTNATTYAMSVAFTAVGEYSYTYRIYNPTISGTPESRKKVAIKVVAAPSIMSGKIEGDQFGCVDTTKMYKVSGVQNADSYRWELPLGFVGTGSVKETELVTLGGTFGGAIKVYVSNSICGENSVPLEILVTELRLKPQLVPVISGSFLICENETKVLYSAASSLSDAISYVWKLDGKTEVSKAAKSDTLELNALHFIGKTSMTLEVIPANRCGTNTSKTAKQTINISPTTKPEVSLFSDKTNNEFCEGEGNVIFRAVPKSGGGNLPAYSFFVNGKTIQYKLTDSVFRYNQLTDGDLVEVVMYPNHACISPDIAKANISMKNIKPVVTLQNNANVFDACFGESVHLALDIQPKSTSAFTAKWYNNGPEDTLLANKTDVYLTAAGGYDFKVEYNNGVCATSFSQNQIKVNIYEKPVIDLSRFLIKDPLPVATDSKKETIVLLPVKIAGVNHDSLLYNWEGNSLKNPYEKQAYISYAPKQEGVFEYSLLVENKNLPRCQSKKTFHIYATLNLHIPNAFTPNGDGLNDTWYIQGIGRFPNSAVKIFNRWGNIIYQTEIYTNANAWDGAGYAIGTYYYIFDLKGNDTIEDYTVTGSLTIVR